MSTQTSVGLDKIVQSAINDSPYLAKRNLCCETHDGRVVLRGQVKTFFQKQMAQEAVRNIDGIKSIVNCLEVDI